MELTSKAQTVAAALLVAFPLMTLSALPHIKWDSMNHNFGAFSEDLMEVEYTFRGINDGDETLVIYDVRPNCGCVVADRYSGHEYDPGDSIEIRIVYKADGRPGRFSKKIQIQSNADPQKQTLMISGTVIGADRTVASRYPVDAGKVRMHASTAIIGDIMKGSNGGAYIKCYNNSPDTLRPEVVDKPEYLSAIVEPKVVNPGEMFVISLNLFSSQCPEWGLVTDSLTFRPDQNSPTTVPVAVTATIRENFRKWTPAQLENAPHISLEPAVIDLGRISRDSGPSTYRVKISNTGRNMLNLRRIWSPDPTLSLRLGDDKVKGGKSTELTVTVDPSLSQSDELINARITIIANDPDQPTTILRVVGEFTD
ncbi:MAG: DUF1573 domain-containing protein [Clostridium sp.]|nr:DUF1573 domain-containing protein [Clostridium sp.]